MTGTSHSAGMARFLMAWLVLVVTAIFLNARGSFESIPDHQRLDTFPRELNGWVGNDAPLSPDILRVLGPGDFLSRTYHSTTNTEPIDLFIAYYPSQRSGDTIHSPQNCMPGAGWTPLQQDRIQIPGDYAYRHGNVVTANRYVLAKGMDRLLVLYWYQARGRTTPSEYWAKIYLIRDSILMRRTDGAMVRVAMPIPNSSPERLVEDQAVNFAYTVLNKLDAYIPR